MHDPTIEYCLLSRLRGGSSSYPNHNDKQFALSVHVPLGHAIERTPLHGGVELRRMPVACAAEGRQSCPDQEL